MSQWNSTTDRTRQNWRAPFRCLYARREAVPHFRWSALKTYLFRGIRIYREPRRQLRVFRHAYNRKSLSTRVYQGTRPKTRISRYPSKRNNHVLHERVDPCSFQPGTRGTLSRDCSKRVHVGFFLTGNQNHPIGNPRHIARNP